MQDAGGVSKPLGSAACILPPEKRAWYMPGPLSRLSLSSTSIDESTVIQLVRSLIGACKWVVGEWWPNRQLLCSQQYRGSTSVLRYCNEETLLYPLINLPAVASGRETIQAGEPGSQGRTACVDGACGLPFIRRDRLWVSAQGRLLVGAKPVVWCFHLVWFLSGIGCKQGYAGDR